MSNTRYIVNESAGGRIRIAGGQPAPVPAPKIEGAPEKLDYHEYHRRLADQNRAALARTGADPAEGYDDAAQGADSRTEHQRYLDELARQNREGLK